MKSAEALYHQQLAVHVKIDLHTHRVGLIKSAEALYHQQLDVQVKIDLHTQRE
jgi:hypothetical protein